MWFEKFDWFISSEDILVNVAIRSNSLAFEAVLRLTLIKGNVSAMHSVTFCNEAVINLTAILLVESSLNFQATDIIFLTR